MNTNEYDDEFPPLNNTWSTESGTRGFSDSPLYDKLKDQIAAELFEINGQLSTLQQFIISLKKHCGDGNGNAKIVEKIDKRSLELIEKVRILVETINVSIQEMNNINESTLDRTQLISREKLNRDVKISVSEFRNTQLNYKEMIKTINDNAKKKLNENLVALHQEEEEAQRTNLKNGSSGQVFLPSKSQMVIEADPINNEEFVYQQNLIQQRDQEINNITQGIIELNEIFQDLSDVVLQQGVMVDNIEANIYSVVDNTQMASKHLDKALRQQKNLNKWCLYLLFILLGFLLFIFMIIFI